MSRADKNTMSFRSLHRSLERISDSVPLCRSNRFGTDEFMEWAKELGTDCMLCLNMGTGTLEDALAWIEYCNGAQDTYWANKRREHGHPEPYGIKLISLGNEP